METVEDRASHTEQVNASLDTIHRAREQVMAPPPTAQRSLQLSLQLEDLAEAEAGWWELLSEYCHVRVYWRAALAAREHTKLSAQTWRHRAARQRAAELALPATPVGVAL